jgi:hypothetical protein
MQVKTTTLSTVLCGLTALSLAGCEAHVLTARLHSAAGASPPSAPQTPEATTSTDPGLYSHQPTTESHATYTPKGCEEPGGCYFGVRLVGYPVEEAKRRAIEFGYKGEIDVFERGGPSCLAGTVCEVEPANWPAFGQTMTLYVNYVKRELTISKPE